MTAELLVPVIGCFVRSREDRQKIGVVVDRAQHHQRWQIKVQWGGKTTEWNSLEQLACGFQSGWAVQDVPLSAVRQTLGIGHVVQTRELAGREQVLVQWDDTGRSTWMPYENLCRVKDASGFYERAEVRHVDAGQRFRLRLLAYALENWNQLTGSLDRLDIDPLPHQIQLVHRIISSGNTNWLIADDVGLGKTIEVGLLLAALKRKGQARRVLIVAPAGLTRQWRDEMQYKFDEMYDIYGRDFVVDDAARWRGRDKVIISLDLAKRDDHLQMLRAAGGWDVVVFDEGHRLTRHEGGHRSERYRLAEALRRDADAFLLLSGTPHQGYTDRFKGLLDLVRPDLKRQIASLEANPEIVGEMILRNRKSTVTDAEGRLIFQGHEVHRVPIEPSRETMRFQRLLHDYLQRGYKVRDAGGTKARAVGFVMVTYRKLASSSIAAIEGALRRRLERLTGEALLETGPIIDLEDLMEGGDDQDDLDAVAPATQFFADEEAMLHDLLAAAAKCRLADEKLRLFLEQVVDPLVAQGKKLLVFTEYRATQTYLEEAIQRRFPQHSVTMINGSMSLDAKLAAIRSFQGGAMFMISTEAGGEGINLQDGCHVMVNYDLPWNPARLVQRIGRLYRYGQREKVIVFNLHAQDNFDNSAIGMMLDRVMTVAREMAPVGSEYNELLYTEIVGELLENLDLASILQRAEGAQEERTRAEIDAAIRQAQRAKELQDEILSYAVGFDPDALGGALGLTMRDVGMFIRNMLPMIGAQTEAVLYDGRVVELRLPEALRGEFPEFKARTVVRVTTDRRLAQRLDGVVLLDFESSFFTHLIAMAKRPEFGGTYAPLAPQAPQGGMVGAYKLRWQNDQGEPMVEEFVVLHSHDEEPVVANPSFLAALLRQEMATAGQPNADLPERRASLARLRRAAELRLADENTRFKHPNGLVLLAAADLLPSREA
jgi:ERCC4-related helicase